VNARYQDLAPRPRPIMALVLAGLVSSPALAGPPFVTDDPDPVELGHGEINIAPIGTVGGNGAAGFSPFVDANYGAAEGVQLHAAFGIAFSESDGTVSAGYGDTELGTKLRFFNFEEDGARTEISTYPMVELPTGDAARGLGAGHLQALLPLWIEHDWGDWTSYGGVRFEYNRHGEDRNSWLVGWVLLRKVTDDLQLGGELYYQTATVFRSPDTTAFNLGGTWDLSETGHILFSAGRGIAHANETDRFSFYLGYQITW